ncbi:MAG: MATE family efflux transporter [Verrucomicrobiota bacterium]|jgi:O-antigen/teichoic acid export membrane protein
MTTEEVKSNIWRNTVSNYICMAVRVLLGLVMFRLLYEELSREEFGFWALLWSIFGYGLLLDFGFGFTAQKRVAELCVHRNWVRLSGVLSTIFFTYVAIGALIFIAGWLFSPMLVNLLKLSPGNREKFAEILLFFFCGLGLAFPLGLFPEMLRGLQRIHLANNLLMGGMIANFLLAAVAIHFHWGLKVLYLIALVCTFVPDLICAWFAFRQLPSVRLHPKFFSFSLMRDTMGFSIYAYFTTVSNILLSRTDQLVLSTCLSVASVSIYQAGAKVAEMFGAFAHQLPDTLSPAAAHLHAKGDRAVLQELLLNGTRFSVMLATPVFLVCGLFLEDMLRLLTGEARPSRETYWVAMVLLFWGYIMLITQSVPKRIFMMCGHERRLMWLSIAEALLNLVISVGLVLYFRNVVCVALGSLIASTIFGWGFLWPWAAREAALSVWTLARVVLAPTWLACLPLLALMFFERVLPGREFHETAAQLIIESLLAFVIAGAGIWRFGLSPIERQKFAARVLGTWRGGKPA